MYILRTYVPAKEKFESVYTMTGKSLVTSDVHRLIRPPTVVILVVPTAAILPGRRVFVINA